MIRKAHGAKAGTAEIILALDVDNLKKAKRFVEILYPEVKIFKVGSQLFTACGPEAVRMIGEKGGQVFLDLKFHDIPNTVANAVRQAVRLKVNMLTLHIRGGQDMLKAAVRAAKEESRRLKLKKPLLIGVTVLTSQRATPVDVLELTKTALGCGLDGIVCSAKEAAFLRKKIKRKFVIVTPGIRPNTILGDDQKRTATVSETVQAGSNFLVVGRPILEAKDPLLATEQILGQMKTRLTE